MKDISPVYRQSSRYAILLALALLLSSCARTPPPNLYQLSANDAGRPALQAGGIGKAVIGIGPLQLPEFLDRPQIVIRTGANQLQLVDGHRWAEPLADNIVRSLRENLAAILASERILHYPWGRAASVDYQIIIEILRFEGEGYSKAHLEAVWSIQGRQGKVLQPPRRSQYQLASRHPDCGGLVQAMSQTLSLICRDIAETILQIHDQGRL